MEPVNKKEEEEEEQEEEEEEEEEEKEEEERLTGKPVSQATYESSTHSRKYSRMYGCLAVNLQH